MFSTLFVRTFLFATGFSVCIAGAVMADNVLVRPSADSTIYEDPFSQTSNSLGQHLFAGKSGRGAAHRALIKFDVVAALPPGAQISDAQLVLTVTRQAFDATTASISRCLTPWAEGPSQAFGEEGGGAAAGPGDPSWDFASYSTIHWGTPGGDLAATTLTVNASGLASVTFGGSAVTSDVTGWLANPATNYGWMIRGDETIAATATRFASRENLDVNARPALTITFTLPCHADLNRDEVVDFFDYLDFVDAFSSQVPEADFNQDSVIDFFDYLDFVDAFSAGCV